MTNLFKKLFACAILSLIFVSCSQTDDACNGDKIADCVCDASYVPVCGCDEVTYSNACAAKCAGVKSFTDGPCAAQNNSIIGAWDFMGYASIDGMDLSNPVKTHMYEVNINFEDASAGNNFFKVSGKCSVNFYSGSYATSGNTITMRALEVTEIAGTPEANQFENLYLKWLDGVLTYTIINKNVLHIHASTNGKTDTLVFKKK
jgi:heat shock protein HslJ